MSMIAQRARYRRLSALALGTSFVMAVVFVVSLQWYFTRVDRYDDFSSLAEIVGTNASAALIFDDARTARETLASLVHSPELIEAGLFRRDGTPLATYHRSAPDDSDARMKAVLDGAGPAFTLREMRVIAPIEVNGEIVGRVVLRVSLNDVYADTARFLTGFLLITGGAFGLAALVMRGLRRRVAQTEQAQREADDRLRSVTDHLPVVLFQLMTGADTACRFSYVSDNAAQLLGIAPERLLADCSLFLANVHPEDATALKARLTGSTPPGALAWIGRYRRQPDGEIWIEMRAGVTAAADGRRRIGGIMQDISQLMRYQEEIEQSRRLLLRLASHREDLVDAEHKKISVEIHDQLGQILTAALFHLRILGRSLPAQDKNAAGLVADIDALLNDAYRSMKDIAASLRPAVLNFGFATAAEWAAERALKNTAIRYRVDVDASLPELDERCATTFFRIVQEALANCVRHAGAANVTIALAARGSDLVLSIADDGRGMDEAESAPGTHLGLTGIRERAMALGGEARIASAPGRGVTVTVVVPNAIAR